jgi:hypothetical protein
MPWSASCSVGLRTNPSKPPLGLSRFPKDLCGETRWRVWPNEANVRLSEPRRADMIFNAHRSMVSWTGAANDESVPPPPKHRSHAIGHARHLLEKKEHEERLAAREEKQRKQSGPPPGPPAAGPSPRGPGQPHRSGKPDHEAPRRLRAMLQRAGRRRCCEPAHCRRPCRQRAQRQGTAPAGTGIGQPTSSRASRRWISSGMLRPFCSWVLSATSALASSCAICSSSSSTCCVA